MSVIQEEQQEEPDNTSFFKNRMYVSMRLARVQEPVCCVAYFRVLGGPWPWPALGRQVNHLFVSLLYTTPLYTLTQYVLFYSVTDDTLLYSVIHDTIQCSADSTVQSSSVH